MLLVLIRQAHCTAGHEHTQMSAIRKIVPHADVRKIGGIYEGTHDPNAILAPIRATRKRPSKSQSSDVAALSRYVFSQRHTRANVVIPSANGYEIRLALELLEATRGQVRCCLRLLRPEDTGSLSNTDIVRLRSAIASNEISLHTETAELKEYLKNVLNLPAEDNFLLPCSIGPADMPTPIVRSSTAPYRVGFLGTPRKEKGARNIPNILRALALRTKQSDKNIVFSLQRPRKLGYRLSATRYFLACNAATKKAGGLSIDWYQGGMSEEGFRNLLACQNLLLLPYQTDFYACRGSGMILDGILAGVPILHTRGIGMKHFLLHTADPAEESDEFANHIFNKSISPAPAIDQISAAQTRLFLELGRTKTLLSGLVS